MKKLLLLFIPLVFLFSCNIDNINTPKYDCTVDGCIELEEGGRWWTLQDCEEVCDCSCGEVVNVEHHGNEYVLVSLDSIAYLGSWKTYYVENYCTQNIGTHCSDSILDFGTVCMVYQSVYMRAHIDGVDSTGCYNTGINFY
tara:strand:- start:60 stop:482 length:423 start_codon:yes stop_codon:yes gene_type:complete